MKGRRAAEAVQYTLRNIPPAIDRALRRKAAREAKSLNEVALEALALGVGVGDAVEEHHDLDFLFGSWVPDPAQDRALEEQRKVDEDIWK